MTRPRHNWLLYGLILLAGFLLGKFLFQGGAKPPSTVTPLEPIREYVDRVVTVPVEVKVPQKIYVPVYTPVVMDSVAHLDTTLQTAETPVAITTELQVDFDLRDSRFKNLMLGHPQITYQRDSVYVYRDIFVPVEKIVRKGSFWKYAEAATFGAAVGIVAFQLAR